MKNKGIHLAWIIATDFEKTIQFYTETLGLQLIERLDEHQWAELRGEDGAIIGINGFVEGSPLQPGQNAVLTYTVDDVEAEKKALQEQGTEIVGEIHEVPGHVKMLLFKDPSGNLGQLVQLLGK